MAPSGLLEAFVALRPDLLRFLSLRGASAEEAEDVLQDVALKLTGPVFPVDQPRAYLYRVAHNHFLLHRRGAGRRERREKAWFDANSGHPPEVDDNPSVETSLIAREQLADLQGVFDALPERTRTIFRRFRLENASRREIAEENDISVSAVEKHLARAYKAVARQKHKFDEAEVPNRSLMSEEGRHG